MHLTTFDDPATSCRVHAALTVVAGADSHPALTVALTIEAIDGGDVRACYDRLDAVVDDHDIVAAITGDLPDVVDVRLSWAETTARVELMTLQGATFEVVAGDRWQCTLVVRWATGSATLTAGVPGTMLATAQALGNDRGLCDVWASGDHLDAWLASTSPFISSDRVIACARFGALRQRAVWLALCDRGVALISGTFTRADLKRLSWPVAWSSTTADSDRQAHEAAMARLKAEGLQALDASPDAVAVVVEGGIVVGVVGEVAP